MKRLNGMLRSSSQWKVSTLQFRDHAPAQGLDVVAIGLALDHRAFAEPAAGRDAGEGDRHAHRRVVAHLEQAVDPRRTSRSPAGRRGTAARRPRPPTTFRSCKRPLALDRLEAGQPGDVGQLAGRRPCAPGPAARQRRERGTPGIVGAGVACRCARRRLTKQSFVYLIHEDGFRPAARHSRLPQLLDEAARAFASRGFAAASVREIVGPIGMLPGSLYCHFATKEALLVAVYREGVERISAAVDAAVGRWPSLGPGSRPAASPTSPRCSTRPTIRRS